MSKEEARRLERQELLITDILYIRAMFSSQILGPESLCKKKIPHHIKIPAHAWSTKYR
jgi:hypothetical protein